MPIIAKESSGTYVNAPAGVHRAVCCDVTDLGMVESTYDGTKKSEHKVRITWEIDEAMDDGRLFTANRRYTLSLHEKASLRKDLDSWRGKAFEPAELKDGFDLEKLIGACCQLNIVHSMRNGKGPYADVASIMPMSKGMQKMLVSKTYVRVKDRPESNEPAAPAGQNDPDGYDSIDDESVPF